MYSSQSFSPVCTGGGEIAGCCARCLGGRLCSRDRCSVRRVFACTIKLRFESEPSRVLRCVALFSRFPPARS